MTKNCHNDYKMKFSVDDEYPDLTKHNNHMAKVQTLLWHGLNMDTLLPHTWAQMLFRFNETWFRVLWRGMSQKCCDYFFRDLLDFTVKTGESHGWPACVICCRCWARRSTASWEASPPPVASPWMMSSRPVSTTLVRSKGKQAPRDMNNCSTTCNQIRPVIRLLTL